MDDEGCEENRLTHYEELSIQEDDLKKNSTIRWLFILFFFFLLWFLLVCILTVTQCITKAKEEGAFCVLSSVGSLWGSLFYGNLVVLLLSFGLCQRYKAGIVVGVLIYLVSLVDVIISNEDVFGLPTMGMFLVWMIFIDIYVWRTVNERILTRGRRKKMPVTLVLVTWFYVACVGFVCGMRFSRQSYTWVLTSWIFVVACGFFYMGLLTIHLRKTKMKLYNGI